MAGALLAQVALLSGAAATILVTVGHNSVSSKFGTIDDWGFGLATVTIDGALMGARSPTTLLGATIDGIFSEDGGTPGNWYLKLHGDQRALTISRMVINGVSITFSAPSFAGSITTWTGSMASAGNQWGVIAGANQTVNFY